MKIYLAELCRYIADKLGLLAQIVFVEYHDVCNPKVFSLARERYPDAHFVPTGRCEARNNADKVYWVASFNTEELLSAANQSLAAPGSKIVFNMPLTNEPSFNKILRDFIQEANSNQIHPVFVTKGIDAFNYYLNLSHEQANYSTIEMNQLPFQVLKDLDKTLLPTNKKPVLFSQQALSAVDTFMMMILCYGVFRVAVNYCSQPKIKTKKLKQKMG